MRDLAREAGVGLRRVLGERDEHEGLERQADRASGDDDGADRLDHALGAQAGDAARGGRGRQADASARVRGSACRPAPAGAPGSRNRCRPGWPSTINHCARDSSGRKRCDRHDLRTHRRRLRPRRSRCRDPRRLAVRLRHDGPRRGGQPAPPTLTSSSCSSGTTCARSSRERGDDRRPRRARHELPARRGRTRRRTPRRGSPRWRAAVPTTAIVVGTLEPSAGSSRSR